MKYVKLLLFLFAQFSTAEAYSSCPVALINTPSDAARKLSISKLGQFMQCESNDPINDASPCNTFASRGLEAVYGVTDFKRGLGHLSANQIADKVIANGSRWTVIGAILDENNNLCAQSLANSGFPVIAVKKGSPHGHVALVIPGEPMKSASWNMLVSNSASFLIGKPETAYVSKPLSNAFSKNSTPGAKFFWRKPDGMP